MARRVSRARVMWIEADPVFGGSRSQVQFPAELSGFFGLSNKPQLHTEVSRGVIFAALQYPSKKMDFHHNDVWRLNLPTARQGLGGYPGTILVFEKTERPEVFRLWLLGRGTPAARLLRTNCHRRGRLGSKLRDNGTRRQYGFF
jgi:hypothetical protein